MNSNKAFSLIELMVVITIVSVLAAIAVPSYRDYGARARLTETYNLLQNQMEYVGQQYSAGTTTLRVIGGTGLVTPTTPTDAQGISAAANTTGGVIKVNFAIGSALSPAFSEALVTITYTGTDVAGVLNWTTTQCSATSATAVSAVNQASIMSYFPPCANNLT